MDWISALFGTAVFVLLLLIGALVGIILGLSDTLDSLDDRD